MKKTLKRILSLALCAVMVMGMLPVMHVHAEEHIHDFPMETIGEKRDDVTTQSITQSDTNYYFTTFNDLKNLTSRTYTDWVDVWYQGDGDLVISESISLPKYMLLYTGEELLHISEDVTFTVAEGSGLITDYISVDGVLQNDSQINHQTGTMVFRDDDSYSGRGNIFVTPPAQSGETYEDLISGLDFSRFTVNEFENGTYRLDAACIESGHIYDILANSGKAPTCTEAGCYASYKCYSCYAVTGGESIPALGHDMQAATCTAPKTCSVCGATEGSALGHDWNAANCTTPKTCTRCNTTSGTALGHNWQAANCTTPRTCSTCGLTSGSALGHDWLDATCTAPKTCSVCGATSGTSLGHNWSDANCTEPKTCTRCNVTSGTALGHTWSEATCITPKTCTRCSTTTGSALGHSWSEATCTAPRTCTRCAATTGNALGHSWNDGVVTKAPTEESEGVRTYTCTVCSTTKTESIPKLDHVHSYTSVVTAPTCSEQGYTTYTCSSCGYSYQSDFVGASGHNWANATCIAPKTCSVCGQTEGNALGHSWNAANCTTPKTCSVCGATEGTSLGHDWLDATCTNPKTCSRCSVTSGTALGHNWDAGSVTKQPTESETGIKTFNCTRCTETKTETIPALVHTHSYGTVVTNPTCTERGYTTYTCACGDSYKSDYVNALGHNYVDGLCTRCGEPDASYQPPKPIVEGVTRIAGADRIATSLGIADALKEEMGVEKFSNIVVASALNFPDALAGSYLAAVKDAPILLTYPNVHAQVAQYIADNLETSGMVYILGGTSAVSTAFEQELSARVVHYKRVSGNDRFSTNLAILNEAGVKAGQTVLVCTAMNFADSLSVSATGLPILLVSGSLRPDQMVFLNLAKASSISIIGGESAVSKALEAELQGYAPKVDRIYGSNRHETSATVAEMFFGAEASGAVVAYSLNFPDGLCGGPLAYYLNVPLLLTVSGDATPCGYTHLHGIKAGYVLGSDKLVNDASVRNIFSMGAGDPITLK